MAEYITGPSKPSFWQRVKATFFNTPAQSGVVFVDRSSTQVSRGSREIVDLYHQSPWLRAVVSKISEHYAAVPWELYQVRGGAVRSGESTRTKARIMRDIKGMPRVQRTSYLRKAVDNGAISILDKHPLLTLWDQWNPALGGIGSHQITRKYMDTIGEVFLIKERTKGGQVAELWPIPATWIKETPTTATDPFVVAWGNTKRIIAPTDMIWLRDHNLRNPYGRGIGTAHSLSDELDADEYAAQLIKSSFENRGLLDVVISIEGAREDQLQRAKAEFENKHRGWLKAGVPFFHSGKANVQVVSQNLAELEVLKLREWERDTIISIYGVPPELLGVLGKSNRATILESREIMASEVLIPRLEYMRGMMNHFLVPEFGDNLFFDYEDPSPGNDEFKLKSMQAYPYSVTVREWRELQGLEDRGEQDEYVLLPQNLYPFRGQVGVEAPDTTVTEPDTETETDTEDLHELEEEHGEAENQAGENADDAEVESSTMQERSFPQAVERSGEHTHNIDISHVVSKVTPDPFEKRLLPLWKKEMEATIKRDIAILKGSAAVDVYETKAGSYVNDLLSEHLRFFAGDRIRDLVDETTRDRLSATLTEGAQNGESVPKLTKRVREVFDVSKGRARTIARTEVQRSANFSTYVAMRESGVVSKREWVSTGDDRTRDDHADMDGVTTDIDTPFELVSGENAGAKAYHPGDFGIAEEDINCRCTSWAADDSDEKSHDRDHLITKRLARHQLHDAHVEKWMSEALPKIDAAFAEQEKAVINALKSQHRR